MELFDKIIAIYPELTVEDFGLRGSISLQDDSDDKGSYIARWQYDKPVPEGLIVGKP